MCYPLKELMSVTPGEGGLQKVYIYVLLFLSVFCLLGIAVITLDRGESTGSASGATTIAQKLRTLVDMEFQPAR